MATTLKVPPNITVTIPPTAGKIGQNSAAVVPGYLTSKDQGAKKKINKKQPEKNIKT